MPEPHETLIEKLIPGDLEHQIPAAVEKVLPGGFKNRLVQIGLGLLLAFGLRALVRRWVEKRERARGVIPRPAAPPRITAEARAPRHSPAPETPVDAEAYSGHPLLALPQITLSGPVDQYMYANFRNQLAMLRGPGPLVVGVSTFGGDPEVARLITDELRLLQESGEHDAYFLGKVSVYSAGTIIMASFPVERRFLTRGSRLMIHERTIGMSFSGTLRSVAGTLRSTLAEIDYYIKVDEAVYNDIIAGTQVTLEELLRKGEENWYIDAEEAVRLGIVREVI